MENSKISDVVITLSSLYELLLNIGKSFDLQENAEQFLKSLMAQKSLSYSAYFSLESTDTLKTIHSIPKIELDQYVIHPDLSKLFVRKKFIIINDTHPSYEHITKLTEIPQGEFVIYYTAVKSIIILAKSHDIFDTHDLIKYELVLYKFGLTMEALASHHMIKDEIKIKEEQAVLINKNNEKLKKQNDELLNYIRSNNELEQFAYRVSHDLNSPLRTIIEFSKLLKSQNESGLNEKQVKYLEYIMTSGNQMKEMISGILDSSKITGDILLLKKININQLIKNTENLLYHNLNETNGKIIVNAVPEYIVADETKMTQLFLNLISNALKFKKKDHDAQVQITGHAEDDNFIFSITDNGIGIPPESQEKIFVLFNQSIHNSDTQGHGIGLNTCQQIIEQHNGRIWLESELNIGTTFHFTLQNVKLPTDLT